jgi:hypothetical protein
MRYIEKIFLERRRFTRWIIKSSKCPDYRNVLDFLHDFWLNSRVKIANQQIGLWQID